MRSSPGSSWRWLSGVLLIVGTLGLPVESRSQGGVGSGPLTASLADTEPTVGILNWGPVKAAPGITISQIGIDSNIFHENVNPKEDFIVAGRPDLALFSRTRFLKVSAYIGGDFTYFRDYADERSAGYGVRARVDLLLSRLFPFVAYGESKTRERPNNEIDTRADSLREELTAGLGFQLSGTSSVYASVGRQPTKYQESFEEGVDLGQSLNRHTDDYSGGLRTALTPLTTLTVRGGYREDIFDAEPLRNAQARFVQATFDFAPQAMFTGSATVGYLDSKAADPKIDPFSGLITSVTLTYPILEFGRINFITDRSTEYSFDASEAYFVSTTFSLAYSQRLFGAWDLQVSGRRALADYGFRDGVVPRRDTTDTLTGGLGYNLRNRTRIALSYEYTRRLSPALPEQNYEGRRTFLSWTYAF
jgi:opacity protein-like surface antigen